MKKDKSNKKTLLDSFYNIFTGKGISGKDSQTGNYFTRGRGIPATELASIYDQNGIARRIINVVADDMFRQWIKVYNDSSDSIENYFEKLEAVKTYTKASKYDRLYGGCLLLMGIEDGREQTDPVNMNSIRSIHFLRVIPRSNVTVRTYYTAQSIKDNFLESIAKIGEPELYDITLSGSAQMGHITVHESRVIRFNFMDASHEYAINHEGWGVPVIESIFKNLSNIDDAYSSVIRSLNTNNETVMEIENLRDFLSSDERVGALRNRIENFNLTRNQMNVLVTSSEEKLTRLNNDLSHGPDIIDKFALSLCSVSGIPYTKLFGYSPSGLSATGDRDAKNYYDEVKSNQENDIRPAIQKLIDYIVLTKDSGFSGNKEDVYFEFNPLEQQNEKEISEINRENAQADSIYLQWGVLEPEEVRKMRGFDDGVVENEST